MRLAAAYLAVAGTLLVLDVGWLGYVARDFYAQQLGTLLADHVNVAAAVAYLAVVTVGVVRLAVGPALEDRNATRALKLGALLGLVVFASFDLAGWAVLRDFSPRVVLADLVWHVTLMAVAARAGYAAVA